MRSSATRASSTLPSSARSALPLSESTGMPSASAVAPSATQGALSHRSYSNTPADKRPRKTDCCGIPITTFTATCTSAFFYVVVVILFLALDCPFNRQVTYFFAFVLSAILALVTMAAINMMYTRYRFNCVSLTVSLLYSGSATLVLLGLISSACEGLCKPEGAAEWSLFGSGYLGNYFIWCLSALGLAFQLVAHYYYG